MLFDPNKEFELSKQELLDIIVSEDYKDSLLKWVHQRSANGLSKKQIYDTLLLFHAEIQKHSDPDDKLYDRLSDFMDGFTSWAKYNKDGSSARILPDEPDV